MQKLLSQPRLSHNAVLFVHIDVAMKTPNWLNKHVFATGVDVTVDKGHEMLWINVGEKMQLGYPLAMPNVEMGYVENEGVLLATFPETTFLSIAASRTEAATIAKAFGVTCDEL